MTITKMGQIVLAALSFATIAQGTVAADNSMHGQQANAKWTMILDEGNKPLGEYTPFMIFEPEDKSKILKIRIDVCPTKADFANLFSDALH